MNAIPSHAWSRWSGLLVAVLIGGCDPITAIPGGSSPDFPAVLPDTISDPSDGKLVHLDGLNLSRAWMLEGIADALPVGDPRLAALRAAARQHREAGLAAVTAAHYEGGHWLGSFATYLVTERGLR